MRVSIKSGSVFCHHFKPSGIFLTVLKALLVARVISLTFQQNLSRSDSRFGYHLPRKGLWDVEGDKAHMNFEQKGFSNDSGFGVETNGEDIEHLTVLSFELLLRCTACSLWEALLFLSYIVPMVDSWPWAWHHQG